MLPPPSEEGGVGEANEGGRTGGVGRLSLCSISAARVVPRAVLFFCPCRALRPLPLFNEVVPEGACAFRVCYDEKML